MNILKELMQLEYELQRLLALSGNIQTEAVKAKKQEITAKRQALT